MKKLLFIIAILVANLNAEVVKWKLAQSYPKTLTLFSDTLEEFAKSVEVMSNGEFIIEIHDSNKHKSPFGVFDFVKLGQYEMGYSASYYWKGKDVNTMFFTTMPFGMSKEEQYGWFYDGGGLELMQEVYSKHNMLAFLGGNTDVQMGGWFKKEIKSLDDLKGVNMRIVGFGGEVISKLGVNAVNIPAGELYTSLDRGTIDALEWIAPCLDLPLGFPKIANYYYSGWHEPASELQFLVNREKFNALRDDLKAILINAMRYTAIKMSAKFTHENIVALDKIKKENPNVKFLSFPKDVMDRLKAENEKLLESIAKENPLFAKILQSQKDYIQKVRKFNKAQSELLK